MICQPENSKVVDPTCFGLNYCELAGMKVMQQDMTFTLDQLNIE
jgi:hypothetical protein